MNDPLVARDCAALDGKCDCPNTGGSVPDACKYLQERKDVRRDIELAKRFQKANIKTK